MPVLYQQRALYDHALAHRYVLPAFNVYNMESMQAVMAAADAERSPVVVQFGPWIHESVGRLDKFYRYCEDCASDYDVPMVFHHDHMHDIQTVRFALDAGFRSVMFDGSALPFAENVRQTRAVVDLARTYGAWVEAELGSIPGMEASVFSDACVYTGPQEAADFMDATGCDCLSVAVGTAHGGVLADGPLQIQYALLQQIRQAVGGRPLVLHGAASLPAHLIDAVNRHGGQVAYLRMCTEEDISRTGAYGVAKCNMDVDHFLAVTAALRQFFAEQPQVYSPMAYLPLVKSAMEAACRHKMRHVTHSSAMADDFLSQRSHPL